MARGLRAALVAVLALGGGTAGAAELVLYELPGCPWCAKWHREIGPVYPKTEEGRLLPLRRVLLSSPPADLARIRGVTVAPTFVVIECGREFGRITGYAGDDMFWGELSSIVAKMKTEGRPKARC